MACILFALIDILGDDLEYFHYDLDFGNIQEYSQDSITWMHPRGGCQDKNFQNHNIEQVCQLLAQTNTQRDLKWIYIRGFNFALISEDIFGNFCTEMIKLRQLETIIFRDVGICFLDSYRYLMMIAVLGACREIKSIDIDDNCANLSHLLGKIAELHQLESLVWPNDLIDSRNTDPKKLENFCAALDAFSDLKNLEFRIFFMQFSAEQRKMLFDTLLHCENLQLLCIHIFDITAMPVEDIKQLGQFLAQFKNLNQFDFGRYAMHAKRLSPAQFNAFFRGLGDASSKIIIKNLGYLSQPVRSAPPLRHTGSRLRML